MGHFFYETSRRANNAKLAGDMKRALIDMVRTLRDEFKDEDELGKMQTQVMEELTKLLKQFDHVHDNHDITKLDQKYFSDWRSILAKLRRMAALVKKVHGEDHRLLKEWKRGNRDLQETGS